MSKTFMDKYISQDENFDDIHDYIEKWHKSKSNIDLHEYLGLTLEEYDLWTQRENDNVLAEIVEARNKINSVKRYRVKNQRPLEVVAETYKLGMEDGFRKFNGCYVSTTIDESNFPSDIYERSIKYPRYLLSDERFVTEAVEDKNGNYKPYISNRSKEFMLINKGDFIVTDSNKKRMPWSKFDFYKMYEEVKPTIDYEALWRELGKEMSTILATTIDSDWSNQSALYLCTSIYSDLEAKAKTKLEEENNNE